MWDSVLTLRPASLSGRRGALGFLPEQFLSSESQERQNQGWRARAASNSPSCPCFSKTCMMKWLSLPSRRLAVFSKSACSTLRLSSSLHSSMATPTCPNSTTISLLATIFPSSSRTAPLTSAFSLCIFVDSDFQSSLFSLAFISTVRTSPLFTPNAKASNSCRSRLSSCLCRPNSPFPSSFCPAVSFWAILAFLQFLSSSGSSSVSFSSLAWRSKYSPLRNSMSLKSSTSFSSQYSLLLTRVSLSPSSCRLRSPTGHFPALGGEAFSKSNLSMSWERSRMSRSLQSDWIFCWLSFRWASSTRFLSSASPLILSTSPLTRPTASSILACSALSASSSGLSSLGTVFSSGRLPSLLSSPASSLSYWLIVGCLSSFLDILFLEESSFDTTDPLFCLWVPLGTAFPSYMVQVSLCSLSLQRMRSLS